MLPIDDEKLTMLIEAALFVTDTPLTVQKLKQQVLAHYNVSNKRVKDTISALQESYVNRGVTLVKVASGYRFQAHMSLKEDLSFLTKERAPKYSRAILETLALIAYKQPITRAEIEDVRGVSVSSYIIKSLLERNWIKVVGHKEVPGKPALYATTKEFLDYFSLNSLIELPELMPLPELSLDNKQADNLTPKTETET